MCIIVLDTREDSTDRVSKEILERCLSKNKDGLGLMYADKGELRTWTSMDDFDELWNRYTACRDAQLKVALHFRLTTQGTKSLDNCHPFEIWPGFGLMHNGTMNWLTSSLPKGISDTQFACDNIFSNLPGTFLSDPALKATIQRLAEGSRFLFMDKKGRYTIINEGIGFWEDHVWYSKSTYKEWLLTGKHWTHIPSPNGGMYTPSGLRLNTTSYFSNDTPDKDSKDFDFHCEATQAGDSWYQRQAAKVKKKLTQITTEPDLILFDYGFIDDEEIDTLGLKYLRMARLPGHALWAVEDADDRGRIRPAAITHTLNSVTGILRGFYTDDKITTDDVRAYYDHKLRHSKDYYRRTTVEVTNVNGQSIEAMTYIAPTTHYDTNLVIPVPFGDWARYLAHMEKEGDEHVVTLQIETDGVIIKFHEQINPQGDDSQCPECRQYTLQEWDTTETIQGHTREAIYEWCKACFYRDIVEYLDEIVEDTNINTDLGIVH